MIEDILRIILQLEAQGVAQGAAGATGGLRAMEAQAKRTEQSLQQIKRAGGELRNVGLQIGAAGLAIAGPLVAAAKSFVDANQKSSSIAQAWMRDTKSIAADYQRIGGVAAKELLPAMDQASKLVDKLAQFAEQNPGLVKAALASGGALIAGGASLSVVGQLVQTTANTLLIANFLSRVPWGAFLSGVAAAPGVAAGIAGSALGGAAIAGAGGVGVGALAYDTYARSHGATNLGQFAAVGAYAAGSIFGKRTADDWFVAIAGLTKATDAAAQAALEEANARNHPTFNAPNLLLGEDSRRPDTSYGAYLADAKARAQPAFDRYTADLASASERYLANRAAILDDFQKTYWDNEANYAQTRGRNVRDFERQETQAQADFNSSRARQLRDFAENEAQNEKSYYDDRTKRARDFGIETERAEADHQAELLRLQDDHADRSHELAAAGDALGFVKEQRAYEKQRAESEKNYQKDASRRNADYALELADAERAFAEQRQQRLADFEQQQQDAADDFRREQDRRSAEQRQRLIDMDADFREQQAKLTSQKDQRLRDLDANYATEKAHIKQAFVDTLNAIDPILTGMRKAVETKMQAASDAFQDFLDGIKSQAGGGPGYCQPGWHWDSGRMQCVQNVKPGRAGGGYVGYGQYTLGEKGDEFVLNNAATNAAERLTGGPLTQERILAALSRSNSYAVNFGDFNFGGGGGHGAARREMLALVDARINDAFDQFTDDVPT